MTLAKLKEELERRAAQEIAAIEQKAQQEAQLERERALKQAEEIVGRAKQEAEQYASKERMRISAAHIKAKRMMQDAQFAVVAQVVDEVRVLLKKKAADRKAYKRLFEALASDAARAAGRDCVLQANKADAALAKQSGKVDRKPLDCIGGVAAVSADGRIKIDNTFEALLEQREEAVRQQAYEMLFK